MHHRSWLAPVLAATLAAPFASSFAACTPDVSGIAAADAQLPAPETALVSAPPAYSNDPHARFELTSSIAGSTFRCAVDSDAFLPCETPFAVTLAEGTHTFRAVAIAPSGVADPTPIDHAWTIDTVVPHTRLIHGPAALDNSVSPEFEFEAEQEAPGTVAFTCALDGAAAAPCASPYHPAPLADGAHTMAITAIDRAGNAETPALIVAWTLDGSMPDTVIDKAPSGTVASRDAIIAYSSPDAAPGSTFTCWLDGTETPCARPWVLTGLNDGVHTVAIAVREPVGNVDPSPAQRTWTIDTKPPALQITGGPDRMQAHSVVSFSFSFDASDAAGVECRVTPAMADFAPCTSPWTTPSLPDGGATFEVRAKDAAGNTAIASRGFGVDTKAPKVTLTGPTGRISDDTPTFEFVADEPVTWVCRIDQVVAPCTSPYTTAALTEGTHLFRLTATDAVGLAKIVDQEFVVDRTTSVWLNGHPSALTDNDTPTFKFYSETGATFTCQMDGGAAEACTSPYVAASLPDGAHAFTVATTDVAGNQDSYTFPFTVDRTPLAVTFTSGPTGPIQERSPTFTWSTAGAVIKVMCRYDAAPFSTCATAEKTVLADGPHTFEVDVLSELGKTATATQSFTVDTVAPSATITGGPAPIVSTLAHTFTFTTSGDPAIVECRLSKKGEASGPYTPCASPYDVTLAPPSSPYPYVFEVRVRDAADNKWSAYRSFTYQAP